MTSDIYTPSDIYDTTWDWVVGTNQDTKVYQEISQSKVVLRRKPGSLDQRIHWKLASNIKVTLPPAFVVEISSGRVWGDEAAVITLDGGFLADMTQAYNRKAQDHPIFSETKISPPIELEGTSVLLAARGGHRNYSHWLLDVLPRFFLMDKSPYSRQAIDYYIVNSLKFPFQRETLKHLSIPTDKIITIDRNNHIKSERLIVPSRTWVEGKIQAWACKALKSAFLYGLGTKEPNRIFISRRLTARRRILNEEAVMAFLEKKGFISVCLETMTVSEQVALFAKTEIVIAPHGAGLANLVFCSRGSQVIEIFSPNAVSDMYWGLCDLVGLEYYYLIGQGTRPPKGVDPFLNHEDIKVDLEELACLVANL